MGSASFVWGPIDMEKVYWDNLDKSVNDFPYSDGSTIIYLLYIPYSAIAFLRRAPVVEAAWSNSSS